MNGAVLAFAATTALLWLGDRCNRRWFGFLPDDPPRPGRKQHARPIPLAGVLLVPPLMASLVLADAPQPQGPWALAAVAVAATVGLCDDRGKEHGRDLGWRPKAIGLSLAAACVTLAVGATDAEPMRWLMHLALAFVLINACNFLDNTDGVTASFVGVTLAANGSGWPLAAGASALAFVPWNWPRPRLFLGDAGAYALGTVLAIVVLDALRGGPRALWLAAVPLADFVQVVVARVWLGLPPWVGDRRHLTHIAQNVGLPRVLVAPLFAALAFAAGRLA